MDMQRVTIPASAVQRMAALHRERVKLDARATTYLTGLADALGIDVARIAGVDDASNELLLQGEESSEWYWDRVDAEAP